MPPKPELHNNNARIIEPDAEMKEVLEMHAREANRPRAKENAAKFANPENILALQELVSEGEAIDMEILKLQQKRKAVNQKLDKILGMS